MKEKISISMDEDLLKIIDKLAGKKYQSRSYFIKECVLKTINLGDAKYAERHSK